ncbi:MAG: BetR domain [Gemmatimonadales bacterium]|jgi:transcriptional regulator with XRE-family HTH domain|nr:BetR domain [Gemmatimonadales bacterium]
MSMTLEDRVLQKIQAELDKRHMSGAELGRRMSVSQATISRRMIGEVSFTLAELTQVAEILQVPVDELLGRTDAFWKEETP